MKNELQSQKLSSVEKKIELLASRDRGTLNSKINLNDEDFFNDLPLNEDEHNPSEKRPFS